ncbi:MAG TPA: DJ-1/PfpI family protein, partial [Treponema sp.]|nr:DJ-1/PfpI family protein [Treponema sp.]
MNKKVSIFLADGFEDVEAITPIDYLRRAGCTVTITGIGSHTVQSAHNVSIICDTIITDEDYTTLPDLIIFPGGMPGASNLAQSAPLRALTTRMFAANKLVGAICAAPAVVLGEWGLLNGYNWTCFPNMEAGYAGTHQTKPVVHDRNLYTARAPGVAEEFALALVGAITSPDEAKAIA